MSTYVVFPNEAQEKAIEAFLESIDVPFEKSISDEKLPEHVIKGIAEGQADFEAGRTITMEEFKKKLLMYK